MRLQAYLEPTISYGWSGGPEFKTRIVPLRKSRRNRRNGDWSQPKHRFTAPYQHLSNDAYRAIKKMHLVCRGQLHTFLFRDELDFEATNEPFGVGDGTTKSFQLSKRSTVDGIDYDRTVHALYQPDPDTLGAAVEVVPIITIDGTPTTAFTLDPDTGEVVFDSAPAEGAVLRWSGKFSLWVRFAQDWLPFSFEFDEGTYGSIDLVEEPDE